MTNDDWTVVAAIGQAAAAAAAAVGLAFSGFQMKAATRVADLQALQEFLRSVTEREALLCEADTDERKARAFNEFLNFLEINAAAVNHGLFPKASREQVVDKLCSSIAVLQEASDWREALRQAVSSSTALLELVEFMRREKKTIAERATELRTAASKSNVLI
jgi:ADP-ribosylglycohydrolase